MSCFSSNAIITPTSGCYRPSVLRPPSFRIYVFCRQHLLSGKGHSEIRTPTTFNYTTRHRMCSPELRPAVHEIFPPILDIWQNFNQIKWFTPSNHLSTTRFVNMLCPPQLAHLLHCLRLMYITMYIKSILEENAIFTPALCEYFESFA